MNRLNIHIPIPCKEAWQQMDPVEQGRFCGRCAKTVVDFTGYDQAQILQFFQEYKGSVCGRFHPHQVSCSFVAQKTPLNALAIKVTLAAGFALASVVAKAQSADITPACAIEPISLPHTPVASSVQDKPRTEAVYKKLVGKYGQKEIVLLLCQEFL